MTFNTKSQQQGVAGQGVKCPEQMESMGGVDVHRSAGMCGVREVEYR